jgi:hypothetical protein
VFGLVDGSKILETQLAALVFRFPDGGGGSIAKKAEADENDEMVVALGAFRFRDFSCGCARFGGQ